MTEITDRARRFINLRQLLDRCVTSCAAGRRLRDESPGFSREQQREALDDAIELEARLGVSSERLASLAQAAAAAPDCTEIFARIAARSRLRETDFFRLLQLIGAAAQLAELLVDVPRLALKIALEPWLSRLAPSGRRREFVLDAAHHPELDAARGGLAQLEAAARAARRQARAQLEAQLGVTLDREGHLVVRPPSRAIELVATAGDRVRVVRTTAFEAVLAPVESPALLELGAAADRARAHLEAVEARALDDLSAAFADELSALRSLDAWVARVDFARARVAMRVAIEGCWVEHGDAVELIGARGLGAVEAQPIDVRLTPGATVLVGPNMGGKTSALRTVLEAAASAALSFPVAAREARIAEFVRLDAVFDDGVERAGLSTFGREVVAIADALRPSDHALVVFDEPARGTNPLEATALVTALCERLVTQPGVSVVATHLPIATPAAVRRLRVRGIADADRAELLATATAEGWHDRLARVMDYRIVEDDGSSAPREALAIAGLLGMPADVLDRAAELLGSAAPARRSGT